MSSQAIHVEQHGDCWEVVREDSSGVLSRFRDRQRAIDAGVHNARMHHAQLLVHGANGAIEASYDEGCPPGSSPYDS